MINKTNNKLLLICIITQIIIFITYKLIDNMAYSKNLILRGWIENIYMISSFFLVILIIVSFWLFLMLKIDIKIKNDNIKSLIQALSGIIAVFIILIWFLYCFWSFAFSYYKEHLIEMDDQKVVARVEPYGFHHTIVNFYIPVNIFFMKESNIQSEIYDGSYDKYEQKDY